MHDVKAAFFIRTTVNGHVYMTKETQQISRNEDVILDSSHLVPSDKEKRVWLKLDRWILPVAAMFYLLSFLVRCIRNVSLAIMVHLYLHRPFILLTSPVLRLGARGPWLRSCVAGLSSQLVCPFSVIIK